MAKTKIVNAEEMETALIAALRARGVVIDEALLAAASEEVNESVEDVREHDEFDDVADYEDSDDPAAMLADGTYFADPGGNSALRAASARNPRNITCPTCHQPNMLTPADKARGYQCNSCADAAEGGY